jgi:hypothetical protein
MFIITCRVNLRTISCSILHQLQLGQFYMLVHHQRNVRVPLEDQVVRRVGYWNTPDSS